jgi:hypothetical protein
MEPFGGPIETPNINRIAQRGLTYTNFHTILPDSILGSEEGPRSAYSWHRTHTYPARLSMHPRRLFVSMAAGRRRPEPPTPVKEPITQRHRKESLHVPDRRLGALGRRVDHCRERAQIIWFCVRRAGRLMTFTAARSAGGLGGGGGKGDSEGATLPNLAV